MAWEIKRTALLRNGQHEILAAFQQDALELHEGWLRKLEDASKHKLHTRCAACDSMDDGACCASLAHVEPPSGCALDELNLELAGGLLDDPESAREWLVKWANRRAANVVGFLLEPMVEIAMSSDYREITSSQEYEGIVLEDRHDALNPCCERVNDVLKKMGSVVQDLQFIASQALKVAGVDGEK
jgi:hypothetical protein